MFYLSTALNDLFSFSHRFLFFFSFSNVFVIEFLMHFFLKCIFNKNETK